MMSKGKEKNHDSASSSSLPILPILLTAAEFVNDFTSIIKPGENLKEIDILPKGYEGKRIGIFGTSANPPTGLQGHVGIVKYLAENNFFDEIWILPVYQHNFAMKRDMEPFEHRYNMCKICMEVLSTSSCQVRVLRLEEFTMQRALEERKREQNDINSNNFLDIDNNSNVTVAVKPPPRIGTIDILKMISQLISGVELHLILGMDTCRDLLAGKWKDAAGILSLSSLECITRVGYGDGDGGLANLPLFAKAHIRMHAVPSLGEVSSSAFRKEHLSAVEVLKHTFPLFQKFLECFGSKQRSGGSDDFNSPNATPTPRNSLMPEVHNYIKANSLYLYSNAAIQEARRRIFTLALWGDDHYKSIQNSGSNNDCNSNNDDKDCGHLHGSRNEVLRNGAVSIALSFVIVLAFKYFKK